MRVDQRPAGRLRISDHGSVSVISVPFHLDEPLPTFVAPVDVDMVVSPTLPAGTPWERMAVLYDEVADAVAADLAAGDRPVIVSGDCTTSLGVVAGLQRSGIDPRVVWFDAHGDVQTPETSTSGYLGGMPLRQLVGGADRTVADRLGLRVVAERDVVLVDARDLDPPEALFLDGSDIRRTPVDALDPPGGALYLHLDVDVIDPVDVAGLLFPAPGGPRLAEVAAAVRAVLATGRVVAIGIACTWRPGNGSERVLAPLVREIVAQ